MEENVIVMARKSDVDLIKGALDAAAKEFEKKVGYSVKYTISSERSLPESRYFDLSHTYTYTYTYT